MYYAQLKSILQSLRFRLMFWNAIVVLITTLAVLVGVREGIRYTLTQELDDALRDDFQIEAIALSTVFDASNRRYHAQLDRKARGHVQRSWFVQLVELPGPGKLESGEADLAAGQSSPHVIWSSHNVPDWTTRNVPANFEKFELPSGKPTTVDDYRVLEDTVEDALQGPVRVRIGASLSSIRHGGQVLDRLMLLHVLFLLLIAPLGGYWLALRATRPLSQIIRMADRLRPNRMDERLPIRHTEDEIDQLSIAFNKLLDRIAEYLSKRQDFLANSAHELRTPLAALRSTAELALSSQRSATEYRELIESIVTECSNLELLVNQLLLLAESESAHFETRGEQVDLSKITKDACEMFDAVAESRGIHLHMEIADGLLIEGSRLHLRQLLNNLIDNAIKFTLPEGQVRVRLHEEASQCQLEVQDTGVGIAAEEQARLFERFYRGDRSRRRYSPTRGTGLGLSICKAIAEAHGGKINVTSQPGEGTTFTVVLPLSPAGGVS